MIERRPAMGRGETTINGIVKQIVELGDIDEIRNILRDLRRDKTLSDDEHFKVFTLVTLHMVTDYGEKYTGTLDAGCKDYLSAVAGWFERRNVPFQVRPTALLATVQGRNSHFELMVVKPSDATIMVFEARSIMKIPSYMKDRTLAALITLNHANPVGAFQFNEEDDTVSFRIGISCAEGSILSDEAIHDYFDICRIEVDKCIAKISSVR
jgi:hypothetical protein